MNPEIFIFHAVVKRLINSFGPIFSFMFFGKLLNKAYLL